MQHFSLTSSAFPPGGTIPKHHGYKFKGVHPSLHIHNPPMGTKSFALIFDDPDAFNVMQKIWVHWVIWNIPADLKTIEEGKLPVGVMEGKTDFGEEKYGGPAPPDKEHVYFFKLYALDKILSLPKGADKLAVEKAMSGHVLGIAVLAGIYAPQP